MYAYVYNLLNHKMNFKKAVTVLSLYLILYTINIIIDVNLFLDLALYSDVFTSSANTY
jgi:hypothetical protein